MCYLDNFKERYRNRLKSLSDIELLKAEKEVSFVIESDIITNAFPIIDELIALYDIIRDECVHRFILQVQHRD